MPREKSFEVGDGVIIYAKVTDQKTIDNLVHAVLKGEECYGLTPTSVSRADLVEKANEENHANTKAKIITLIDELR
jgi:hypothetical protein